MIAPVPVATVIPRVLVVAGSDSGGGAGLQADLKTVTALGGFAMTAVTALTAQNTRGVLGVVETAPEFVALQIDACVADIGCDAVKTGMLGSAAIVEAVAAKIREHGLAHVVVDPVMIAKGGSSLLRDDAVGAVVRLLLPLAEVATPNLPEAARLVGRTVDDLASMREAARAIHAMGARHVVVKGGHLEGEAVDVFYDGGTFLELRQTRIETADTHGTGCIFASAIAAALAGGESVESAVATAKRFVTGAIRGALRLGSGHGPANPAAGGDDDTVRGKSSR
jgi:hydroxymethylpyrimidine/phosphomethylpyrimidine kinase